MSEKDTIIQPREPDHLAKMVRQIDDVLDDCCMKMEAGVKARLKEMRQDYGPLAKAMESGFSREQFKGKFGTGISAYLKEMVVQRCVDEYTDSEV